MDDSSTILCVVCYGSKAVCAECFAPIEWCGCDVDPDAPLIIACPDCETIEVAARAASVSFRQD